MSRRQLVWGAGATVLLAAASSALINELHQGWPWWLAAVVVTGAGAVLAARLAAGPPDTVLALQMPSEPSVIRFYVALLAALGAPLRPRQRLAELEQVTLGLLRAVGVRVLVIDELHNVLTGRGDARREFLNLIRFLGNELRIPLVGVGTREAYLAIRSDDQLENRFEPFTLPRWQPDAEACSLLASFATSFPLRRPSPIATEEMAAYLLTRSDGTIGELPGC